MDKTIAPPQKPPCILVIDDERLIRVMLRNILEREEYCVEDCDDAQAGLATFQQLQPDLVLLDALMPGMDGFRLCAHLRSLPGGQDVPILMVTALIDNEAIDLAFEAGATDYIIKPIHPAMVRQRVRQVLRAKQNVDELRHSEAMYRAVVEDQTEFICRYRPDTTLIFANDAYCRYFGQPREALVGQPFTPHIPEDQLGRVEAYLASLGPTTPVAAFEHPVILPNGQIRLTQWTNRVILDSQDQVVEIQAVGRDVTRQRETEAALAAVNAELEQALTHSQELTLAAEQANRAKSEFLANMSHELRTPLTVILGNLSMLADPNDMPEAEEVAAIVQEITASGEHLLVLINDLLDLSKIEAGHMALALESLPAEAVVEDVLSIVQVIARQKGLRLETQLEPLLIQADYVRLKQILLNLVGNAIKFTDQGRIVVRVRQTGHLAEFQVADTGRGIAPQHLPYIFDQFKQGDGSSTRRAEGTGLGLAISKKLVEMHRGQISVNSRCGRGSVFTFTIPLTPVEEIG